MTNHRNIKYIVVHCTGTQPDHTGKNSSGYHYLIQSDGGVIQKLHEKENSKTGQTQNEECVCISYIGGIDKYGKLKDTRSRKQEDALFDKIVELSERYPEATITGHRDLPNAHTACPAFDVKTWLANYTPKFYQDHE